MQQVIKIILIAITAFALSGCIKSEFFRGVLTDAYTSAEETRRACEVEKAYRLEEGQTLQSNLIDCDAAVEYYNDLRDIRVLLDETSLRDWIEDELRQKLLELSSDASPLRPPPSEQTATL